MKKNLFSLFLIILAILCGCERLPPNEPPRPRIIVSLAPYKTFVEAIAGDKVDVVCLVPKGTNPHLYETPPQLVEKTLKAKLWLRIGEPAEKKFVELFVKRSPGMRIIDLSQDLPLIGEEHSHAEHPFSHHDDALDRHIWLSPRLAKIQVKKICEALCILSPENTQLFYERLHSLEKDLSNLDDELISFFAEKKGRTILLSHPSLGYFCRDYSLEQLSLEVEGKEPLPRDIEHLFGVIHKRQIDRILIQPQHATKGALRMAEELHLSVVEIDPYAENYFTNLRSIAHAIGK